MQLIRNDKSSYSAQLDSFLSCHTTTFLTQTSQFHFHFPTFQIPWITVNQTKVFSAKCIGASPMWCYCVLFSTLYVGKRTGTQLINVMELVLLQINFQRRITAVTSIKGTHTCTALRLNLVRYFGSKCILVELFTIINPLLSPSNQINIQSTTLKACDKTTQIKELEN